MKRFLIILIASIILIGCNSKTTDSDPKELVIGFVPSEEAARMIRNMKPVTGFLEKELGIPIKTYRGSDYTAIIEGMKGEKVDIGIFGPFSYVLASDNAGAEPLVVPCDRNSKIPASYSSILITHKNSPIRTLEDLKSEKKKYSLSFSDPASTSGHLVPRGYLHSIEINPEDHFTEILFSGSHTATILSLVNEKVDLAGCSLNVFNKMIEREMIKTENVNIIWKSNPMPVDLVTVRSGLSQKLKNKLQDIYLRVAYEEPASAGYFYEEWNDSTLVFLAANDSLYSEIRSLSELVLNEL